MARVHRTKVDANWMKHINGEEEQRLAIIQARIVRKKKILEDVLGERKLIMARAIKRMRRAEGKS